MEKRTAEEKREDLEFILNRIREHGGIKRLGHMFQTPEQIYFYDSGTGKVEKLEKEEASFFRWLFERGDHDGYEEWCAYRSGFDENDVLKDIRGAVVEENLLLSPFPAPMRSCRHQEELKQALDENMRLITLELTGRCNLRCGYCIYNDTFQGNRNFSEQDMSEETAKKAIRHLTKHSGKEVSVTFYGGEPLLKYELIQTCVAYARELMHDRQLSFSLTSNMTLMTRDKAEYFLGIENFYLVASLDGPQELHDAYRRYPDGSGSFRDTLRGLKILAEVFGSQFASRVSLSMVFTPPYTFDHVDRIYDFFAKLDWLPEETEKLVSYPEEGSVEYSLAASEGVALDSEDDRGYVETLSRWTKDRFHNELQDKEGLFTKKLQQEALLRVHKRSLSNKPTALQGLNGCCVPGTKRLYVTAEGDYKVCERIGVSPVIGNVEQGLSYEKIKKYYIDEYIEGSERLCQSCWAYRLCGVCYAKIYSEEGLDNRKKEVTCMMARHNAVKGLEEYHMLLETDPDSLLYLNDIQYG